MYQEVRGNTSKQGEQISRRKSSSRFDILLVLCPKPLRSGADVRQILKRKSGQAGSSDGHPYLRTRRLELYVKRLKVQHQALSHRIKSIITMLEGQEEQEGGSDQAPQAQPSTLSKKYGR